MIFRPSINSIETNAVGINEILSFYSKASLSSKLKITFDLQNVSKLDANLAALLLAVVHRLEKEQGKTISIEVPEHMNVLERNGLVAHLDGYGNENPCTDERKSTIPLYSFQIGDDEAFAKYLTSDLFSHRGLAKLSPKIKKILRTHFIEVFNNVEIHSNSKHPLFTCGQFFPHRGVLKFSMVDLGDGFLKKIKVFTDGLIKTDKDAIQWALADCNTTKDVNVYGPGGTGLKDLKTYCAANNGAFQIGSGSRILTFDQGQVVDKELATPFKGALINLIFRDI